MMYMPLEIRKIRVLPSGNGDHGLALFKGDERFSCVERRTYSARERAELLYDAITARDKHTNEYLYHDIYLPGGNGAEDTIIALEALLKGREPLPKRQSNLNIFGFSDVSQLHHYFGQSGIATPFYYSGLLSKEGQEDSHKIYNDILKIRHLQQDNKPVSIELKIENDPNHTTDINGFSQPGFITAIEHRLTHQLQCFPEGSNMLFIEVQQQTQIDRLVPILNQMCNKDFALILSAAISPDMIQAIKKAFPQMTIFSGAPVGHNEFCAKEGKPIPLFARSKIKILDGRKAEMEIEPFASKEAETLQNNPKRYPKIIEDTKHATTNLTITSQRFPGGVILSDLSRVKQHAPAYTIHVDNAGPNSLLQRMELCIKELLDCGIIDADKLEQLCFTGECAFSRIAPRTAGVMQDLITQYLPKLKGLTYNGSEILKIERPHIGTSETKTNSKGKNHPKGTIPIPPIYTR